MAEQIEGFICGNTVEEFTDRLSKEVCDGQKKACGLKHGCVPVSIDIDVGGVEFGKPERLFTAAEVVDCLKQVAERYRQSAANILKDPAKHFKPAYNGDTPEEASRLLVLTAWDFDLVAKLIKGELQEYAYRKDKMVEKIRPANKEKSQEAATP